MRRPLALASAVVLAAVLTGSALATHGGAQHRALGNGSASAETTTQTPIFALCGFFSVIVVGSTTTTTTTAETFVFDSRLTTEEAEDVILAEPHGHMRIDYQQTTARTSQFNLPPGCTLITPIPPNQTISRSATASADVTCLTIVNNRATIGGRVTRFEGDFTPTRGLLFNATDNTIAKQQVAPDQFAAAFVAEAPQVCPAPTADHPITDGDILVEES